MHDGHPRCVAKVSYTQFDIVLYDAIMDDENLMAPRINFEIILWYYWIEEPI